MNVLDHLGDLDLVLLRHEVSVAAFQEDQEFLKAVDAEIAAREHLLRIRPHRVWTSRRSNTVLN